MRRTQPVPFLVAFGAAAAVLASGCERPQPKVTAVKPPVVIVSTPVSDYVTDYEDFTGRTDAIYSVEIRARVSGYLDKVHFKDGDEVKEGDMLFEIDPRLYKADLDRADATVAQNKAHLRRLDADFALAFAGVHDGDGGSVGHVKLPQVSDVLFKEGGRLTVEDLAGRRDELFKNIAANHYEGPRGYARMPKQ